MPGNHEDDEFVLSKSACHQTGVYIAYPASPILKSINKSKRHKTMVNDQHTKLGIAKSSFMSNKKEYLEPIKTQIISAVHLEFQKVGRAREWFNTSDRQKILEIISNILASSGIEYQYIAS